ncbi:MAG: carcinine hydrolase/isopenicillin-N N-acyltransferase family protein [Clostridia bacterium]|nr:carcinine hydrolase/isopenicillin-N N-acyltransferase family protein [Clostridia bacterium]
MEEFSRKKLNKTMESLQLADCKLQDEDRVYLLNYKNPYFLDYMLEKGTKGILDFYIKATMKITAGIPLLMVPGRFACSCFNAKTPDGKRILARNFDYKDSPCMVVWCSPENGYKSVGIADMIFMSYGFKRTPKDYKDRFWTLVAPYAVMDGMNEKGLCISILEQKGIPAKQSTSRTPIITTLALRAILDKCATVDEAIALLDNYDMHDVLGCNYHYQIIDREGGNVIIEYVDNKMVVIRPEEGKDYQYLTNFLVSAPEGDRKGNFGYSRYFAIRDNIEPKNGIMTEDEAMSLLEHIKLEYRHHLLNHRVTSLWSIVYNIDDLTFDLCAGADYSKKYTFGIEPATWQK